MSIFTSAVSLVMDLIEKLKGSRILVPLEVVDNPSHHFVFEMSNNTKIKIHCEERRYRVKYKYFFVLDKTISIFKVYPIIEEGVAVSIKKKFGKELYITNLWHPWASTEQAKKRAIAGFIDLIYQENQVVKNK